MGAWLGNPLRFGIQATGQVGDEERSCPCEGPSEYSCLVCLRDPVSFTASLNPSLRRVKSSLGVPESQRQPWLPSCTVVQLDWRASKENPMSCSLGRLAGRQGWTPMAAQPHGGVQVWIDGSGQEAVRLPGGRARLEGVGINVLGGWRPPAASS